MGGLRVEGGAVGQRRQGGREPAVGEVWSLSLSLRLRQAAGALLRCQARAGGLHNSALGRCSSALTMPRPPPPTHTCTLLPPRVVLPLQVLFGLPRLLTGSILAHELMHAYLRLSGLLALQPQVGGWAQLLLA